MSPSRLSRRRPPSGAARRARQGCGAAARTRSTAAFRQRRARSCARVLDAPEHRANLLGRYSQIGIALSVGTLEGHRDAHVWTQEFGSHCGAAPKRHHIVKPHFGLRTNFRAH